MNQKEQNKLWDQGGLKLVIAEVRKIVMNKDSTPREKVVASKEYRALRLMLEGEGHAGDVGPYADPWEAESGVEPVEKVTKGESDDSE